MWLLNSGEINETTELFGIEEEEDEETLLETSKEGSHVAVVMQHIHMYMCVYTMYAGFFQSNAIMFLLLQMYIHVHVHVLYMYVFIIMY